jgi:hypothetical protein
MVGAPLSVTFLLHYYLHYSTFLLIILAIIHSISKHGNGIHCRNEPLWQELKQHIFTRRQAQSMCPVLWRKLLWTHVLQRRRSGCISANQHAWLDETYRPRLQPIGRYQRVCPATRDLQFQDPGEPKIETVKIIRIRCIIQNK